MTQIFHDLLKEGKNWQLDLGRTVLYARQTGKTAADRPVGLPVILSIQADNIVFLNLFWLLQTRKRLRKRNMADILGLLQFGLFRINRRKEVVLNVFSKKIRQSML